MPTPARLRPSPAQRSLISPAVAAPLLTMQGEGTHRPYVLSRLFAFRDPYGLWFGCDHLSALPGRLLTMRSIRSGSSAFRTVRVRTLFELITIAGHT